MAVVLAASALTALTAIFTRVTADALPYQDWPMFLQNPLSPGFSRGFGG